MKNNSLLTIKILLFMSIILLIPTAVYATEGTPVTLQVSISGDTLRIEATGGAGIEAVFINERRINYRVDNTIELDLQSINSANIAIHAIDFAGSRSEEVTLINPRFTAPPEQTNQNNQGGNIPAQTPAVQTNPNALTPDGQATVLDHTMNTTGQEFFTFATPAGNVFFLVIDHESPENNVYFLNAVTEQDLVALAEQAGSPITPSIPEQPPSIPPDYGTQEENEPPAQPEMPPQSNSGTLLFILMAAAVIGAAYYIKVYRKKNEEFEDADKEEDGNPGDDLGEELKFEEEGDSNTDKLQKI